MLLLVATSLACYFPGFGDTSTPTATSESGDQTEESETATPSETATLDPEESATVDAAETPTPTLTPTVTLTPTATAALTPTVTATAAPVRPGPPLTFLDPPWEFVEWHEDPGTNEWVGTLRARVSGGTPPYRAQLEDQAIVAGLEVPARWRMCKPMPATIRVWSADGQAVHKAIWVYEVGCNP